MKLHLVSPDFFCISSNYYHQNANDGNSLFITIAQSFWKYTVAYLRITVSDINGQFQ